MRSSKSVHAAAFSPDGKRVVSGSDEGLVMIWNVETGAEVRCCLVLNRAMQSLLSIFGRKKGVFGGKPVSDYEGAHVLHTGGPDVIRKEAWPFYRTISGVRPCWELEQPKRPEGQVCPLTGYGLRIHVPD